MAAQIEGNYKDGWQSMNEKERNVMADVNAFIICSI